MLVTPMLRMRGHCKKNNRRGCAACNNPMHHASGVDAKPQAPRIPTNQATKSTAVSPPATTADHSLRKGSHREHEPTEAVSTRNTSPKATEMAEKRCHEVHSAKAVPAPCTNVAHNMAVNCAQNRPSLGLKQCPQQSLLNRHRAASFCTVKKTVTVPVGNMNTAPSITKHTTCAVCCRGPKCTAKSKSACREPKQTRSTEAAVPPGKTPSLAYCVSNRGPMAKAKSRPPAPPPRNVNVGFASPAATKTTYHTHVTIRLSGTEGNTSNVATIGRHSTSPRTRATNFCHQPLDWASGCVSTAHVPMDSLDNAHATCPTSTAPKVNCTSILTEA
mmetsp:Transcript_65177/g.172683  ORF Transcript_65177/g.172683 Transcript_65177/m.172683 type:complete len:331 (+) Transcript_65177:837-1829(+)